MEYLSAAFQAVMTPGCLLLMVLGTAVGIVFGAMPGMSATLAISVFMSIVFTMDNTSTMCLLMSLYIGAISGGLISAILINIPGTPSSVATCFDGAPMVAKGQAAKALGAGIVFSFIGTVLSVVALMFMAPTLAKLAIKFGPYEYFAVTVCSLLLVSGLAGKNLAKGVISALIGLAAGLIGCAPVDATFRFTFGSSALKAGLNAVPVMVGLFAFPELLRYAKKELVLEAKPVPKFKGFGFTMKEFIGQIPNTIRSTLIGLFIGILPGIGGGTSNLISYAAAKNSAKPEKKKQFGTGIIDGVVASEAANNASIGGAMIPLLSLGIPGDGVTAILMGAFTMKGLNLGPLFFKNYPEVGYTIYIAMAVSALFMVILEFFCMRGFVKIMSCPLRMLLPPVMFICAIGAFTSSSTNLSLWVLLVFGLLGFVLGEFGVPLAPMIIGFVIGPVSELYMRRGFQMSGGSFLPFITESKIGMVLYTVAAVFIIWKIVSAIRGRKKAQ